MRGHVILLVISIVCTLLLSGCLKGEQQSIQRTDEQNNVGDIVENNNDDEIKEETDGVNDPDNINVQLTDRTLYLMDADGMVVPKNVALPVDGSKAVAKQVLQYLVEDGPIAELLPNGFQAVIPANTEILGVHITEDGTLIVDFSEEFLQYDAENERQIVESITNTVSQFDTVKRMKLRIEGEDINEMPVNGTPIAQGFSKNMGLNIQLASMPTLGKDEPVTIFIPKQSQTSTYFVPVTTYVTTTQKNIYADMMEKLLQMDEMNVNGLHVLNDGVKLIDTPVISDGVLHLTLSEEVLLEKEKQTISDDVMEMITRTFTNMESVQAVQVSVEDIPIIKNENGQVYDHPVTSANFDDKHKL